MSNLYEEYAILDAEEKVFKAKKEKVKIAILSEMAEKGMEKLETTVGKFTISKLKTWEYPDEVVKIGEDFKEAKARAESTGEATYTENPSLRFTSASI